MKLGDVKKTLHVVHCVDAEGPLEETLDATFERLKTAFGIVVDANLQNLHLLQNQELDVGVCEKQVADFIAPNRIAYLSTWKQVEEMISKVVSPEFRDKFSSPDGSPYTYSWFIIDVIGYKNNPRRKPVGYNVVWDHYQRFLKNRQFNDVFGWHFHSVPPSQEALEYSTTWSANDYHEQCLSRRLIKYGFFPSLFRAGGVIERNDISHWLERIIPFDYSNQNKKGSQFKIGDQSDWRNAPVSWGCYQPCFYDYRKEGVMRRSIFKCIDVSSPDCSLSNNDVEQAFVEASQNNVAVLSYTNHDRRDMIPDIEHVYQMLQTIGKKYPQVEWKFSNALEAARSYKKLNPSRINLSYRIEDSLLIIRTNVPTFSGDIFLAIEEYGDLFYRDNVTIESDRKWAYRLHRKNNIKKIGIAATTIDGATDCLVIDVN